MKRRGTEKQGSGRDGRLVYSSGGGRTCPNCEQPVNQCRCRRAANTPTGDGTVRIRREVKGRRGKTVTTVTGVPVASDALQELGATLKRRCGSGGSVKDGVIEIQGDHRETLREALEELGHRVKLAGG